MTEIHKWGIDQRAVAPLIKIGFLKSTFERNVSIYRCFLERIEQGDNKTQAAEHTGQQFKISHRHIFRIISKFSEIKEL